VEGGATGTVDARLLIAQEEIDRAGEIGGGMPLLDVLRAMSVEISYGWWYGLEEVALPRTLRELPDRCLMCCISLVSVNLYECGKLCRIGRGAFALCSALRRVEIPGSVEEMGRGAWKGSGVEELALRCLDRLRCIDMVGCYWLRRFELPALFGGCVEVSGAGRVRRIACGVVSLASLPRMLECRFTSMHGWRYRRATGWECGQVLGEVSSLGRREARPAMPL
jgi:hypothetical protein